jgi:arylsulfatase A-like enzyme
MNVVLVFCDTLRADFLGCYGKSAYLQAVGTARCR